MKVNIYETVEVSDEDRKKVAAALGQKTATREDLKAFIWRHGSEWQRMFDVVDDPKDEFHEYAAPVTDEDLIGGGIVDDTNVNGVPDDQAKYDAALAAAHKAAQEALVAENEDLL